MRLKTFHATDMGKAMKMVREALGDDAVIISTDRGNGKNGVTITAAIDPDEIYATAPTPNPKPITKNVGASVKKETPRHAYTGQEQQHTLYEIRKVLRFHNLPDEMIERLMEKVRGQELSSVQSTADLTVAMTEFLTACYRFSPLSIEKDGWRIMLVGPPGIGKTLAVAKIATALSLAKKKLVVVTTDNKRAGGMEQLESLVNIMGLELIAADSAAKLRAILSACPQNTRILIDSAGANPYSFEEMRELGEMASINEIEPVLVMPAGGDVSEAEEIARAYAFFGIKRLLVTRADMARRHGGLLSAALSEDFAFSHMSAASRVVDACQAVTPASLAALLTKHRLEL